MTTVEYEVQGKYEGEWEMVTTEATLAAAEQAKATYDANEPGIGHRIRKVVVSVLPKTLDDLAAAILANLRPKYDLVYVDRDDRFTDEQIAALVAGDWDTVWEKSEDWESDQRYHSVKTILTEAVEDVIRAWEREDPDADFATLVEEFDNSDQWDTLQSELWERDGSEWPKQLARGSGSVLLRIPIDTIDEDHSFSYQTGVTPQVVLERLEGIDVSDANANTLDYVLANHEPEYGVTMGYWIVGADVEDLYNLPHDEDLLVEIQNPWIYLGNPFSGSGFISENPLIGTVRIPRKDLRTDKGAFGYSVNDIYGGLYASQFEAKITPIPLVSTTVEDKETS